jgi:hypothetical protein
VSRRDRLVWGAVGALSFLVRVQGYELAVGRRLALAAKLGVAVLVGSVTAGLVPLVERRFDANESA